MTHSKKFVFSRRNLTPDGRPLFILIHEDIKNAILQKKITEKDDFPTIRELMLSYEASRETIRHALNKLAEEKYITTEQGVGSFVNSESAYAQQILDRKKIDKTVIKIIALCRDENVNPEDILKPHLLS